MGNNLSLTYHEFFEERQNMTESENSAVGVGRSKEKRARVVINIVSVCAAKGQDQGKLVVCGSHVIVTLTI